jgi:hypothetical protein
MKIHKVNMIEVHDWDELVKNTYGRPYNFQQQDGCKERGIWKFTVPDRAEDYLNKTIPEEVNHPDMGVSFASWLSRDTKTKLKEQKYDYELELWWNRNFYPEFQMVANDLHKRGLLETGDYTINIDW